MGNIYGAHVGITHPGHYNLGGERGTAEQGAAFSEERKMRGLLIKVWITLGFGQVISRDSFPCLEENWLLCSCPDYPWLIRSKKVDRKLQWRHAVANINVAIRMKINAL